MDGPLNLISVNCNLPAIGFLQLQEALLPGFAPKTHLDSITDVTSLSGTISVTNLLSSYDLNPVRKQVFTLYLSNIVSDKLVKLFHLSGESALIIDYSRSTEPTNPSVYHRENSTCLQVHGKKRETDQGMDQK